MPPEAEQICIPANSTRTKDGSKLALTDLGLMSLLIDAFIDNET